VAGDTPLPLTGDDAAHTVPLPFPFYFYGQTYDAAFVTTNGHLNFRASSTYTPGSYGYVGAGAERSTNRVDVTMNGAVVLDDYDLAAAVGPLTADRRTFQVTVAAGGSIAVGLGPYSSALPPAINAVRVTHRPDL
jgi:hypothetical protein